MFIYRGLASYFKKNLHIYVNRIEARLSSIAVVDTERSYANHILQESIHRIIDVFGKLKKGASFLFKTLEPLI